MEQPLPSLVDSCVEPPEPHLGRILWYRRKLIAAVTVTVAALTIGVSLVLPKTYTAEATILPTSGDSLNGMLAASMAAQLGPVAGMLGGLGGSKTADLMEILNSRTIVERVIEKANLKHEMKGWRYRDDLIKKVKKLTRISGATVKNKAITITVKANKPEVAATMANSYVSELKEMIDEIGYNEASVKRKFVESQLNKTREGLIKAEDELTRFQAENRLVSLPETVSMAIKSISELEAQQITSNVEASSTDETISAIRSRVNNLQGDPNLVLDLELKKQGLSAQQQALSRAKADFLSKLSSLPPKGMVLARLQREVQVQNALYLALSQQYQTALINEEKKSEAFVSLDSAVLPEKPSAPNILINGVLGLLGGLALGISLALAQVFSTQRLQENSSRFV